jgi:DNA-dependent protein kinase catalytic subunit
MEGLVDQVGELRESLHALIEAPNDPVLLQNATHCALEMGNELIDTKVALEGFPFDLLLGQNGVAGDLKTYTGLLFDNQTLAGSKEFITEVAVLQQNIIRILRHVLTQYSYQVRGIQLHPLQGLIDKLYYKDKLPAKLKVEALKLMENCIPNFKQQDEDYDVEIIAHKYYKEYSKASKLSPTIQAQVKIVLGKLIQVFPERLCCIDIPQKLLPSYINYLSTTVHDKSFKTLDLTRLEGTLAGLNLIIDGIGFNAQEDVLNLEKLYDALKKICKLKDVSRRGAFREGLALFSRHSSIFSRIILKDVKQTTKTSEFDWYSELMEWRASKNKDDRLAGQRAMTTLFEVVSLGLAKSPQLGDTMPRALQYLVDRFKRIMTAAEKSPAKDISLAIQGYGQFAKLLARYLSAEEYKQLCLDIVASTERFHIEAEDGTQDRWRNEFHCHIKSIGSLIAALDNPSPPVLHSLESLCLQLIRKYPYIPYQFHAATNTALVSVLDSCPKEIGPLLENLVYHGLVESCSYPAVPEHQILPPEVVSYKKFIPLWLGLLKKQGNKNREKIFEVYMTSFIQIIDKLDLTVLENKDGDIVTKAVEGDDTADESMKISLTQTDNVGSGVSTKLDLDRVNVLQQGKHARVCKDYTILVNIVDLSLAVIDSSTDLVKDWLERLLGKVCSWSYQHPEASRFYALIARIITLINFKFDGKDLLTLSAQQFFRHHFTRMAFFDQTELRIAAYSLVASIPVQIVRPLLPVLPQAVGKVLDLSKTVPELGNNMLKTMLSILDNFPDCDLDKLLRVVMPRLRTFLSWRPSRSENKEIKKYKSRPIKDKAKRSGGEKLYLRNLEEENCKFSLDILSQVSSSYKELVLPTPEMMGDQLTVWDTRDHLTVEVPLPDVLLPVHLDPLLPCIVEMAQQTADRKARVAAGEALHALLLLMIGRTSQQTDDMASKVPMTKLFKRVFPLVLKLAGDSDSVILGLFQPLFSQLIHWFTKDSKRGSPETECLLECLIDTICSSKDMDLKQDAGAYLQEFVTWSIKQAKANSTENANIKLLLVRLYFLLRHPDVNKRLGGCVVFSHIYRIFREDRNLVSVYLLEILDSFLQCLKISESDPPFSATVPECEKNLVRIKRILLHYRAIFQVESLERRLPVNIDISSCTSKGTVPSVMSWLLDFLTAVEQPASRRAALLLVDELCKGTSASLRRTLETKYGSIHQMLEQVLQPAKNILAATASSRPGRPEYIAYCAVFELALWLLGRNGEN